MVDLRGLPSNGLRGNYAIWRGNEGKQFALQIGRRRRELLTRFVVRKTTGSAPVDVSICLLDRSWTHRLSESLGLCWSMDLNEAWLAY